MPYNKMVTQTYPEMNNMQYIFCSDFSWMGVLLSMYFQMCLPIWVKMGKNVQNKVLWTIFLTRHVKKSLVLKINTDNDNTTWAMSIHAFRKTNTVFPHIVSAETIIFWNWKSKGHNTKVQRSQYIKVRKIFKRGNYSRGEIIWGNTVVFWRTFQLA